MTQPGDLPDWMDRANLPGDVLFAQEAVSAPGTTFGPFPVGVYNSIICTGGQQGVAGNDGLLFTWTLPSGAVISDYVSARAGVFMPPVIRVPVRADTLSVTILGTDNAKIALIGSMRVVDQLIGAGYTSGYQLSNASAAMTSGNSYTIGPANQIPAQGLTQIACAIGGTTVKGAFFVEYADVNMITQTHGICDDQTMHTQNANQEFFGTVILPPSSYRIRFSCTTSGTGFLIVSLISQGR